MSESQNSLQVAENTIEKAPWLKPYHWKPGESGNPGGRPKSTPLTRKLREIAEREERATAFAENIFQIAESAKHPASVAAARTVLDRVEGPVADDSERGGPTVVQVVTNITIPAE